MDLFDYYPFWYLVKFLKTIGIQQTRLIYLRIYNNLETFRSVLELPLPFSWHNKHSTNSSLIKI